MERLRHLDAARGVAALAVVIQHALEKVGVDGGNLNLGRYGVLLFFMLSGFVIPFSFSGEQPLRRFAITRFFRLYPAYWVSLIFVAIVTALSPAAFLANATMVQTALGYPDAIGAYWTLFYELIFYFLCAVLFTLGLPTRLVGTAAVLCLALSFDGEGPMFLAFMLAGTLLRKGWLEGDQIARPWAVAVLALLVLRAPLTAINGGHSPGFAGAVIPAILTFIAALRFRPRSQLCEWLGKISYSNYLFHGVILLVMPVMWAPAYVAIVIGASLLVASASFRWIETPAIAAGKRLARPNLSREPVPA